jgi:hypothetical protein
MLIIDNKIEVEKLAWGILMKLHRNVHHHKKFCHTHEPGQGHT